MSTFFCKFKAMKIRKELIGAKVWHPILNQYIHIIEGQEKRYKKLGLDIFETAAKPKLQKNVKSKEVKHDNDSSDINGVSDNLES